MYPVLAIVGPTGSGKSDLALCLARLFAGEIINCDSVQVYLGLNVGSAKTPIPCRGSIPHHLLDVISPVQELTAGAYSRLGRLTIAEILSRQHLPVLVGGTGLYIRALLEGLSPAPVRDETLRQHLRQRGIAKPNLLHRYLRRFDPLAASRIHQNDHQKLIRAVELIRKSGQPATRIQSESRVALAGSRVLKIGLDPDRKLLYEKLNDRTAAMFQHGLLEETRSLLDGGVPADAKSLQTIGYRQAVQVITAGLSLPDAVVQCQTKTRQYAKRQMTWFRREPDVQWLSGFGSDAGVQSRASELCRQFLGVF